MKTARTDLLELMSRQGGVVSHNCQPDLIPILRRMGRTGELVSVLPGIFAMSDHAADPLIRMRAAQLRDPDAVFLGMSAAHLLWDIPHSGPVAVTGRTWSDRPGFQFSEFRPGPEWVTERHGLRCTIPALTAVDLIPDHGGEFVDRVLRTAKGQGARALQQMWEAITAHPSRPGNVERRVLLSESRDMPWSEAERLVHAGLRAAGITGWRANHGVETSNGKLYFLDVCFPTERLVLEVDGFSTHSGRDAFERDRERQNDLVTDGWRVLRITWSMIQDGRWIHWVQRALSTPSAFVS